MVTLQESFHKFCLNFIRRLIDLLTHNIEHFIISTVSELGSELNYFVKGTKINEQ